MTRTHTPANRTSSGVTIIELIVAMSLIVMLSGTLYMVMRHVMKVFDRSRTKLDILQTTRIIMSGIRNELRNAADKPQFINDRINIPMSPTETIQYYFDDTRRLYRGRKGGINDPDPPVSALRPFLFDDGQILKFEFDSSYRDSSAFVESELALNSKVWAKISMTILYSDKFKQLSETDKRTILEDPNDPRVKTFFMMITPRKVNWLLQATQ